VPYLFSALAEWTLLRQEREASGGARKTGPVLVAILAFLYSSWAIAGSGQEAVYWGFLLLMAGVPVYVWVKRGQAASRLEGQSS
jgi:APA family basic amino acid/polyamine antiporter